MSQAFDRIWHNGLIYKLRKFGIPLYLLSTIQSFLSDRSFSVKIQTHLSNPRPILAGVPQGSPLSPTLFNIFTADIPTSRFINTAQFADDTSLFLSGPELNTLTDRLQRHLHLIEQWTTKWRIMLNPSKSLAKIFTLRHSYHPRPLMLNNSPIPWSPLNSPVKYLGLYLDSKLTWKHHIETKLKQAHQKLHQLKPIINRKSSLSPENTVLLYKSILRPLLLYACPIWCHSAASHINKIQVFQNRILRIATKAPWFVRNSTLHSDFNLKSIKEQIIHTSHNFFLHLPNISGPSFYNLGIDNPPFLRIKNRYPLHSFLNCFSTFE